jgi:hypothetical protein
MIEMLTGLALLTTYVSTLFVWRRGLEREVQRIEEGREQR